MKSLFACLLLELFCVTACTRDHSAASRSALHSENSSSSETTSSTSSLPKIVAFGDSLTAGLGLSEAESYPALLQQRLQKDGYKYQVINAGVSGDTSAGGLRRIDWSLDGNDGEVRVVILELGANDFLRGQPVSETKKNLAAIIDKARERGAKVLLAGMTTETSAGSDYRRDIDEAYKSLARTYNVPFIPFFLEHVAGVDSLNQPDHIHPNAQGEKIVAETVYRYLRPMLDDYRGILPDRKVKATARVSSYHALYASR